MADVERLSYGPSSEQFVELRVPDSAAPAPVVVLIHGGFWRAPYALDLMYPICDDLVARGFATWNIEYRRGGQPGGGYPGTLVDVAAAIDLLADHPLAVSGRIDLGRVGVIGHSAGGHLALWHAGRDRLIDGEPGAGRRVDPAVTVSLAGVADLYDAWREHLGTDATVDFLGGSPDAVPHAYAVAQPSPLATNVVLIHGDTDDRVPVEQARGWHAARPDRVRLIEIAGEDHFAVIDPTTRCWAATVGVLVGALQAARR